MEIEISPLHDSWWTDWNYPISNEYFPNCRRLALALQCRWVLSSVSGYPWITFLLNIYDAKFIFKNLLVIRYRLQQAVPDFLWELPRVLLTQPTNVFTLGVEDIAQIVQRSALSNLWN
jgi:hypothetical protein